MKHSYRLLNRTRLSVNLLESRIQPGSFFSTGPGELGAPAPAYPSTVAHNVSVPRTESIRIVPAALQRPTAETTPDMPAHPGQLFDHAQLRAALLADGFLADPLALGASTPSRLVRQRADSGVMPRQSGIADVAAPSASSSTYSRAIPRAVVARAGDDAPMALPLGIRADSGTNSPGAISAAQNQTIAENYGQLPLSFEQNVGQFDERVDFVARTGGMTTFLTPTAAVFSMQNSESRIQNLAIRPPSPLWGEGMGVRGPNRNPSPGLLCTWKSSAAIPTPERWALAH